jgi:hypothetical protein
MQMDLAVKGRTFLTKWGKIVKVVNRQFNNDLAMQICPPAAKQNIPAVALNGLYAI